MKLYVLFLLVGALSVAFGAEPVSTEGPRNIQTPSADAEEPAVRDPFAAESSGAKPVVKVSDPLESVNRAFFTFNDKLYFWVLKPVSKGYSKVAPEPFRQSIKKAFLNVRYPVRLVNNLLQGKFKGAGVETARFLINSTVGIGGLFDPAQEEWELRPYFEDLDQTFGFYRLPTGIYFDWPIFGPSSVRGTIGTIGDSFLSPLNYIDGAAVVYGTRAGDTMNSASLRLGEYEDFKKASFDPYLALRNAYFENRQSLVDR